jgi:small GTP-binding protein
MSSNQITLKICIVGNSGVGKTTLLHQYLSKTFKTNVQTTIGSNFFVKYLRLPEIYNLIALQVWDLAGQARFRWVRNAFYKGAKGIVYVFDITQKNSFEVLMNWKQEVETVVGVVPCVLVGNKTDLLNHGIRTVSVQESESLTKELSATAFFETSAKLGTNVDDVFLKLAEEMCKKR